MAKESITKRKAQTLDDQAEEIAQDAIRACEAKPLSFSDFVELLHSVEVSIKERLEAARAELRGMEEKADGD